MTPSRIFMWAASATLVSLVCVGFEQTAYSEDPVTPHSIAKQKLGAPVAATPATTQVCKPGDPASCGATPWTNKTDAELRELLTPEQFKIARESGTERAFTGKYWNEHAKGVYHCAVCNNVLFNSDTKFESGTGWPSFYKAANDKSVSTETDTSHGMKRTEVKCATCGSHLGHLFDDGPEPTGLRYCMNSAVLKLEKADEKKADAASTEAKKVEEKK
jgi:peptide-methionine (R)-S-oxide reductase